MRSGGSHLRTPLSTAALQRRHSPTLWKPHCHARSAPPVSADRWVVQLQLECLATPLAKSRRQNVWFRSLSVSAPSMHSLHTECASTRLTMNLHLQMRRKLTIPRPSEFAVTHRRRQSGEDSAAAHARIGQV